MQQEMIQQLDQLTEAHYPGLIKGEKMTVRIEMQHTPNPFAFKFVLDRDVKKQGKMSFREAYECYHIPLARAILDIPYVKQVYFFENVITVTYEGFLTQDELKEKVELAIRENIDQHNPDFQSAEELRRSQLDPQLLAIEEILDRTIRPGLQADGGDVQVMELHNNVLTLMYEGACGTCPSSTMGTLEAIKSILRDEFDPALEVITY